MIITMGKSVSKEEQIVIAQNASTGNQDFENQVKLIGSVTIGVLAILTILILLWLYRRCTKRAKSWVQKQMNVRDVEAATVSRNPHPVVFSAV